MATKIDNDGKKDFKSASVLRIQRKQRLEMLVHKRIHNFNYLKKIHTGGSFWLNVMLFTSQDVQRMVSSLVPKSRTAAFYYLGLSVFNLLDIPSGTATVQGLCQLIEEYEYFCSGTGMQSMKLLMAKNSQTLYPQTAPVDGDELVRTTIHKFQNSVVFEHLKTPLLTFELDYVEVVIGLCDGFARLYEKFLADQCYANGTVYEAIVRLDARVKHHFINLLSKELTDYSCKSVAAEAESLRFGFGKL